jgi:preprotein translocase subunit SecA
MRIFATDTIKKMMGRFNIPEDEPIENKIITNSLEKAQEKIEGFNFDARKHILEYDDVLNYQRNIIYKRRRNILLGGKAEVDQYLEEVSEDLDEESKNKLAEKRTHLEKPELLDALKRLILQSIDMFWVDHLEMMDYLRGSVNLRAYGQRDPLVEYKKEGLRYFKDMEESIRRQVSEFLLALDPEAFGQVGNVSIQKEAESLGDTNRQVKSVDGDIGRNDPCPCGAINPNTGKPYKYKQCGLINAPYHKG